jgi:hypothetical protein
MSDWNETDTLALKNWRCRICGYRMDCAKQEAERLLCIIFFESFTRWDEFMHGLCYECFKAAHNKKHPGLSCCEARLGEDEGCCPPKGRCFDDFCEKCYVLEP